MNKSIKLRHRDKSKSYQEKIDCYLFLVEICNLIYYTIYQAFNNNCKGLLNSFFKTIKFNLDFCLLAYKALYFVYI